ncbi:hypothetical protein CEV31_0011 [Brucella thiophenivorans]|uniref:Uncharacterized protein n=1 Tax=Brucella thiophenivorans TaxID=571255 RepID=A0A256G861_9HYPH|nr:hypothetical protein CEV31_0011 [Brucella thiophenivorans]
MFEIELLTSGTVFLYLSKSSPPLFQIPAHASVLPKAARDFEEGNSQELHFASIVGN